MIWLDSCGFAEIGDKAIKIETSSVVGWCVCVEKASVDDHTGWIRGGGLDTFLIVIPPCAEHFLHVYCGDVSISRYTYITGHSFARSRLGASLVWSFCLFARPSFPNNK